MSTEYKLLVTDFAIYLLGFVSGLSYGSYVFCTLKIRLNRTTKIRWALVFLSMTLRFSLVVLNLIKGSFEIGKYLLFAYWLQYQLYFMIILMLFFTIIGSWKLSTEMRKIEGKAVRSAHFTQDLEAEENGYKQFRFRKIVQKNKLSLSLRTNIYQLIYGVVSLALVIITVIIDKNMVSKTVPHGMYWG
jgi:hypothetical protein